MAQAILQSTALARANMVQSDLAEANLRGTAPRGTDLAGACWTTSVVDSSTTWDETTRWSAGFCPQAVVGAAI